MNEKYTQTKRMMEFIIERGFATGFVMNENNKTVKINFTPDGQALKILLKQLFFDFDNSSMTNSEFFEVIMIFIKTM